MRRVWLLVAAIVAVAVGGGYAYYSSWRIHQRDVAAAQALAVAPEAATAIFSYDYRTFDAAVANGRQYATGTFAHEYARTTTALKDSVVAERAVVSAQVSVSGVVRADPDHVEVLLYVDQHRRNVTITGERVDQNRIVLTLIRVSGTWKVSAAAPL
jgi:Mce-associated membrane protein